MHHHYPQTTDTKFASAIAHIQISPASYAPSYNRREIFIDAWRMARTASRRFGGKPTEYIAMSLKQSWAKASARALSAHRDSSSDYGVYFICIDEQIDARKRILNQPLLDVVFTKRSDAVNAVSILKKVYKRPFIKTSPYYRLH